MNSCRHTVVKINRSALRKQSLMCRYLTTSVWKHFRLADENVNIQSSLRIAEEFLNFIDPLIR